jgi:hypothetical protein
MLFLAECDQRSWPIHLWQWAWLARGRVCGPCKWKVAHADESRKQAPFFVFFSYSQEFMTWTFSLIGLEQG